MPGHHPTAQLIVQAINPLKMIHFIKVSILQRLELIVALQYIVHV